MMHLGFPSRRLAAVAVPAVVALAAVLGPAPAAPIGVDTAVLDAQKERIAAIKKVHPAIVAVCIQGGQGVGSGVVIDPEGYALRTSTSSRRPARSCKPVWPTASSTTRSSVGHDKVGDVALDQAPAEGKGEAVPLRAARAIATR